MALLVRSLDVPPDPLALARALDGRPGRAWWWDTRRDGVSFVMSDPIETRSALDPEPELAWGRLAEPHGEVPRWLGLLPYEACRGVERARFVGRDSRPAPSVERPLWLRYGAVARVAHDVEIIGDDPAAVAQLERRLLASAPRRLAPIRMTGQLEPEPPERHRARILRALELIARGELYQVNLARRWAFEVQGDPLDLLVALAAQADLPFAAAVEAPDVTLVAASPELFLRTSPDRSVVTMPIKGTRPRGSSPEEDTRLIGDLASDPKERAELTMVLDVERNDLGRIAETGSVQLVDGPRVATYGTVHHRLATLRAAARGDVTRTELLGAMLPSGSVTGAPKVRAMEVIANLEAHRRGLYTGAYGALRHDGTLELAMAIRCLTLRQGRAHYFAGGGIVADSDPEREVEETRWKARQLLTLLARGNAEPGATPTKRET